MAEHRDTVDGVRDRRRCIYCGEACRGVTCRDCRHLLDCDPFRNHLARGSRPVEGSRILAGRIR